MIYKSIELLLILSIVVIFLFSVFLFLNSIIGYKSVTGLSRGVILQQEIGTESFLNGNKLGYIFPEFFYFGNIITNLKLSNMDIFLLFINNQIYSKYLLYSFIIEQVNGNNINCP
jgi:hypothetical protein